MESIVDYYMSNPINRRRYYFDNMTLSKFCSQNGYSYFAIYQRIKRLENQEKYDTNMDTIRISIEEYAKKLHIKDISDTFKNLENMKFYNSDEIKNICHFLKIDYDCVLELIEMDFSYVQAINMIWYFGDSKNEVDDKIITNQKIEILFSLVNKISKATNIDIDKFLLYDLIGLYKCKLYDTRSEILMKQHKHIHHIVYYMCDAYGIKAVNSIVDDFSSEVKLIFLEIINNICLNTEGQMVKYIDLTLKGNLRRYIERYQRNIPITSLDEPLFSNEKTKTRIDYIADYKKQSEASEDAFGSNMLEALSNLTTEDLSFIMLKYQEDYTDEELGEYFKMDIEEIKQKEVRILSSLRNNPNVQNLEKNYKKSFVP